LAFASISLAAEAIQSRGIHGNYIEARTVDVYAGPCYANGEAEQIGREAIFGWKVNGGSWGGVDVAGLSVVGVIRSQHTLGYVSEPVNPATAVLIVDNKATPEQSRALVAFAKHMAGDLLKNVVKTDAAPIELTVKNGNIHGGAARLTAGTVAAIQTRSLNDKDHLCGNEDVWYQPLTKTDHAMATYSEENIYKGGGLGRTWDDRLKRSSFLGTFQVSQ
jgi:hypothetical protein